VNEPTEDALDRIAADFDARASRYNLNRWHREVAEQLVARCALTPREHVLDAATGTGFAALAAARVVGPTGLVIGVDVSPGMLSEASRGADAGRLTGLTWHRGDATRLPADWQARFDVVTCAAGLLYMDVARALAEWRRVLKGGGRVAFTSMAAGSPPAGAVFRACAAKFGVRLEDPSAALGSVAACREALRHGGFDDIRVEEGTVRLGVDDHALAWESNLRSVGHAAVLRLSQSDLEALQKRYIAALERASRESPETVGTAAVLYALGRRR
jgi:ubiquinone/menaquinone biosynthesis C-methylase UbiE